MKVKFLIPFAIFAAMSGLLYKGLSMDPTEIPSAYVEKAMPAWSLQVLNDTGRRFSPEEMKGRVWILNVWSTWCAPCVEEHPYLLALKENGTCPPVVGFLYKDDPARASIYLHERGNPYETVVFENENRVGIDLGISGVPETFIIDKKGQVRAKFSRPLDPEIWRREAEMLIAALEREEA